MKLTITTETTGRRGKQVTVIRGITHNPQVIETLTKKIKTQLGTGGTIKGKDIVIQGAHLYGVKQILTKEGYTIR